MLHLLLHRLLLLIRLLLWVKTILLLWMSKVLILLRPIIITVDKPPLLGAVVIILKISVIIRVIILTLHILISTSYLILMLLPLVILEKIISSIIWNRILRITIETFKVLLLRRRHIRPLWIEISSIVIIVIRMSIYLSRLIITSSIWPLMTSSTTSIIQLPT